MKKEIMIYKWSLYTLFVFIISLCCYYFFQYASQLNISYTTYFTITGFSIIFSFLVAFILFLSNILLNKKHDKSFQYLQEHILYHAVLSEKERIKAETIFKDYYFKALFIKYLSSILLCISVFISYIAIVLHNSYTFIIFPLAVIIIIFITELVIILMYNKKINHSKNVNSYVNVYFSYLCMLYNYRILSFPFAFQMNVSVFLSRMGDYEWSYHFLDLLWNEEKHYTKRKNFKGLYNFNQYIFSLRLKYDENTIYKENLLALFQQYPRLVKSKTFHDIPLRLKLEEAFSCQQWQDVIEIIESLNKNNQYYGFMLYISYSSLNELSKAQNIYQQYHHLILFQKLIELYKKQ